MIKINDIDFNDATIKSIEIFSDKVEVLIEQWNNEKILILFEDYWRMIDRRSINREIGEVLTLNTSELLDELHRDIIDEGGDGNETAGAIQVDFYESWSNKIILKIVSNAIRVHKITTVGDNKNDRISTGNKKA